MPAAQYPFIDVAVHQAVRDHFARGAALVLFSADMDAVLWANGTGAAFFGNPLIYEFLEDGPNRQDVTFRQLAVTAGQLSSVGDSRALVVRVPSGFQRVTVQAKVEMVEVRPGERAVLFVLPASGSGAAPKDLAQGLISGFDDPDTHMAVLDMDGVVVAASEGFAALDINSHTAHGFVGLVANETSRLLKRPLSTNRGYLPAAIGRICDEPGLNLLFVVETILGNMGPGPELPAAPALPLTVDAPETVAEDQAATEAAEPVAEEPVLASEPAELEDATEETIASSEDAAEDHLAADEDVVAAHEEPLDEQGDGLVEAEEFVAATEDLAEVEESVEVVPLVSPAAAAPPATVEPVTAPEDAGQSFTFDPNGRSTRFVWKIDAEGRFSEVSGEFATAIGPRAAAINGVLFSEIAARLQLDPEGKVSELLKKRDTWSGKTIYWPVEGTPLRVPVDLAALPTYTRNRDFDGFRGFGVVRISDAIADDDKIGLTLVDGFDMPAEDSQAFGEEQTPATAEPATLIDILNAADAEERATTDASEQPRVEPPAIYISEPVVAPISDKIIQFEERRARNREVGLTPGEEAAFREIGRKLDAADRSDAASGAPGETETTADVTELVETPVEDAPAVAQDADVSTAEIVEAGAASETPEAEDDSHLRQVAHFPTSGRKEISFTAEIIDVMPVALLVHVGERLIHANPEFLKLSGYESIEALEQSGGLDALLQRQDLDDASEQSSRIVVVREDDVLVPVSARLQSIRWDHATALMLSLVPAETGATEPVREDSAVDEAAAREVVKLKIEVDELKSILETATDGVVIIGTDGEIRSMNRSASALFNYEDDEVRGKPFVMLFAHESQRGILDYLSGLSGHGVASVLNDGREVIGREASGGFLPLFMTIGTLTSSNGYCAVIRDITQWKRTEEELRSAKRAAETANAHKSDFLARVSHEIRTPLNAIIGFADIMANEHFGPIGHARYGEYSSDIVRSGRHVLDIVNDLLDISKIEAGEMDLDFTAVGLNETVQQAVSIVQPQANGQRVIVRTSLSQAVPSVVADLRSIKQIVLNILANAIRFTPSGGQIIVSTAYEQNGSVVLRIRDTGIGMSRAELEQAMKPFRQVSTGMHARGDGTGLGLPLTKAMVDANRAQFAIHSAPNEGTLVEITFPSPRVLAD